jgi:hypothetical protein
MKILRNERGIALVTALMLTLVSLTIVMGLLYLITRGVQLSGAQKRYRTALEASYGGAELVTKEIIPLVFQNFSSNLKTQVAGLSTLETSSIDCLRAKLRQPTALWPSACSQTHNSKTGPDVSFELKGTGNQPFKVYTKIVDTIVGNSDIGGLQLEGSGVAEGSALITPQHFPYVYRMEVQGERTSAATEQANLSVLYAY